MKQGAVQRLREALVGQVIPAVCRDGVRRVRLPRDLAPGLCPDTPDAAIPRPASVSLLYVLADAVRLQVAEYGVDARAGDILLLPETESTGGTAPESGAAVLALHFTPGGVTAALGSGPGARCTAADRTLFSAAGTLVEELSLRGEGWEIVGAGLLLELLGRTLRALSQAVEANAPG